MTKTKDAISYLCNLSKAIDRDIDKTLMPLKRKRLIELKKDVNGIVSRLKEYPGKKLSPELNNIVETIISKAAAESKKIL